MTKSQVRKLVLYLLASVVYIHISGFMAHYYTEADLKKSPTTINKVLLKPLNAAVEIMSFEQISESVSPKTNTDKLVEKSTFYIFFFSWPFLLLCALIYWIAVWIILAIILLAFMLSMSLSLILWGLAYVVLGFKIF